MSTVETMVLVCWREDCVAAVVMLGGCASVGVGVGVGVEGG